MATAAARVAAGFGVPPDDRTLKLVPSDPDAPPLPGEGDHA